MLIKLRAIEHDILWKKKISVKYLERAKPSHSDEEADSSSEGKASELGEYDF